MDRRIFHKLISIEEVIPTVSKHYLLEPLGIESVELSGVNGRVLAEDIYSPIDHPPFDRSMVDGYALRSEDVAGADDLNPVTLRIIGDIKPGEKPDIEVRQGEVAEIATGAMIPRGADSVVMVEYTRRKNDHVEVYRAVAPGENISGTGNDISFGDLVLKKGTVITPNIVGLLAGLGINSVKVYVKPKIAVFSTGNEVVEPGDRLVPGKVYDVNGYLVTSTLNSIGADAKFIGLIPDDEHVLRERIEEAMAWADVIITSGGTSAGLGDIVYRVFDAIGQPGIIIHGLKVKPGKPTVIAVARNKLLIGLPGFPLSCYMILEQVVKPIIYRLLGTEPPRYNRIRVRIPYRVRKPMGKTWLLPASIVETDKGYVAYPVSMRSGSISPLIYSDGFIVLQENVDLIEEDEIVDLVLFKDLNSIPSLNIIGSNDIFLNYIISYFSLSKDTRIISTGSLGGWRAVKRGEADIAPTHLLDEETLTYNIPFIEKMGLKGKAQLIRGYDRRIGIIVPRGNPKNITSIEDFLREDVIIVNRTRGSGIRVYLDYVLRKIAEKRGIPFFELVKKIKGYTYEVKTHTAVAAAVYHGRADAGMGIEQAAKAYNLDFIPLRWEHYDFLINKSRTSKNLVKRFIDILRREKADLNELANRFAGYNIPDNIGEVIAE